jgi:hypothetical protein
MTTATRVHTGASHADLCALLGEFAAVVKATPARQLDPAAIADALAGFADTLGNLHSEPGDDRDVVTVAEHRAEIGLCPDSGDHFYGPACRQHECPTWRQAAYDDYVADTGRLR